MEHILTKCEAPGQEIVWDLASELWRLKTGDELRPSMARGAWGLRTMNLGASDAPAAYVRPHHAFAAWAVIVSAGSIQAMFDDV
jgi:hypothetical protein